MPTITVTFLVAFLPYVAVVVSGCQIDKCQILPGICQGKTCTLDDSCKVRCICDESSTAESCLEPTSAPTAADDVTNSSSPPTDTGCPGDFECVHGFCNRSENGVQCVCDVGWVGEDCGTVCSLSCPEGHRCGEVSVGGPVVCLPVSSQVPSSTPPRTPTTAAGAREKNVCNSSHYERPARSEHECGLPCVHGVCRVVSGKFGCECDPGSDGVMCQHKCCLDCNDRGRCYYNTILDIPMCNCIGNYTGPACMDIITTPSPGHVTEPSTWYQWVAGVSAAMLLVLLVLLVAVPYVLWRHRVILVMKIIHYFQSYEDDDDRQWDAFVSYKSSTADEKFVVRTLFPKLEKELGFRLHLHFRDFVPGDTIANNIIRAVLGSRRTILVVSPEFACAEWTKFEYQVAQQEMLKRKHRIIPIVLEDLSDCKSKLDPNLKAILEAVTYLEWPKCGTPKKVEKFWKRLELSLPKKKASPVEQDSGVDNSGYDTIRPDAVDVSMVSEKTDRGLQNGYTTCPVGHEPEEDYDTINEAEMDERNRDLNEKNTDHGEKNTNVSEKIKDLDERYRDINEKYSSRKNTDIYLDILNGETLQTVEV